MPRVLRIALLMVALAAMIGVATAAASPAHIHADSSGVSCDICFTAHVAAYEATSGIVVPSAPDAEKTALAVRAAIAGYQLLSTHSSFTRGPPLAS